MCGIVGALSTSSVDGGLVEQMRDRLAHRGPDHAGLWLSEDRTVCLGHRRLAIVDLNPEANQPMVSGDGRFAITFNGEIYNFRSLRLELELLGTAFRTNSDTEVLLEAYRHWGEGCLDRLSGQFAFALWDSHERRLLCARDRAGEKPFYYAAVGGDFLFASELKSLLLWPGFRKEIHYPALVDYLSLGFVPDPKSIWEGCYKLPPGHWMSVDMPTRGGPVVGQPVAYWDMEFAPDHAVQDWGPAILETLQAASKEMAFADVPLGAFLSGGVDSSSVTAALSRAGCQVNSFTVGFEEQGFDERPWAREVSDLYGTAHTERVVQPGDVAPVFDKMVWHYDEPFNDYSYLPTFYLCREARRFITVALSGDGGDEMFAGYVKYQRLRQRESFEQLLPFGLSRSLAGVGALVPGSPNRQRTLQQYGFDAPTALTDMLTIGFRTPSLQDGARGRLARTLREYAPQDTVASLLRKAPPEKVGLVNAMRYLDLKLTLAGDMLVKVDRASMAVSLEVRPVYLHRDVMALAARIPPEALADRGCAKKVLKDALRPWLPESVLYRKKQGFAMPLGNWFGGELGQFLGHNGAGDPLDEFVDPKLLNGLVESQLAGRDQHAGRIHSLLFLRRWLQTWIA